MKLRFGYLGFCILGAALPYSQFIPWLRTHGLDLPLFFTELFSTRIGGFFGMDVLVSALVLWVFIGVEGKRLAIKKLWIPVAGTVAVGVSFGLPLFLYMRQLELDTRTDPA
ncbi:MAG TPA: DUF2834 domain-containing protein [Gemmatimonadota bacterium]|nr:DUF2834 domain-containing protein [Gemmatimonadota bacterium]